MECIFGCDILTHEPDDINNNMDKSVIGIGVLKGNIDYKDDIEITEKNYVLTS